MARGLSLGGQLPTKSAAQPNFDFAAPRYPDVPSSERWHIRFGPGGGVEQQYRSAGFMLPSEVLDGCHLKCSHAVGFMDGYIFAHHKWFVRKSIAGFVVVDAFDIVVQDPVGATMHQMPDFIIFIGPEPDNAARITMELPQLSINVAFGIQWRN